MKQLFLDLTAKLDELETLKWKDEDKGQLNFERPPVLFPAALVEIIIPKTHDINKKLQAHEALITVRLAFNFMGNTNTDTPDLERQKSLGFYETVEEVKNMLHGWGSGSFNELSFKSLYPEKRPDAIKVVALTFATGYRDTNE